MSALDIKNLKTRYLIWCYKTTKESLDKIERKFTQLEIDKFILKELKASGKSADIERYIAEFEVYIQNKEKEGLKLKFEGKKIRPEYRFLCLKLDAIEKAIVKEYGLETLLEIKDAYEKEMTGRILQERQQKV